MIGSGRLGAESSRTRRATREGVRVWPRLWRGVERGRRDREFAWNTLLACLVDRAEPVRENRAQIAEST